MSQKNAMAFMEKIRTEKEFADSVRKSVRTNLIKIAEKAGFSFTDEELRNVLKELPDDALAAVTGGGSGKGLIQR